MTKELNTVWRITDEDIRVVAKQKYPNASEETVERVVNDAHKHFTILDWEDAVEIFIDGYIEEEEDEAE